MKTCLFCLFVGLCVLCSMSPAAISLKVNGQDDDTLQLKIGQTVQIEIHSDDTLLYEAYTGFDGGIPALGKLSHPVAYSQAGSLATITGVSSPPVEGYYAYSAGTGRVAGLHFSFAYTPDTLGQTVLKLYDGSSISLDSIDIFVESDETGTGFNYQGRLLDDNQSADGLYDFVFTLFDAPSEGTVLGTVVSREDVKLMDGYFTTVLDFGDVFGNKAQWLQISVRPGDSTGDYTILSPRQRLTASPQTAYAARSDWNNLDNIPAGFADNVDNDTHLSESQVENFIGNDINSGYVPYGNGTKLITSPLYTNGQEMSIGTGTYADRKLNVTTNSDLYAIYSDNTKTSGNNYGVVAAATGNTAGASYGLFGAGLSASGTNFGVYGTATAASPGINYGVYGAASNSSGSSYAGYFSGDVRTTGILNKDYDLRIAADAGAEVAVGTSINSIRKLNLYTNTDTYGIFSENALSGGERYGLYGIATGDTNGYSYGVYGKSLSGAGHNFGVWGEAVAATPYTNYGIFGTAANDGSGNAFAGYFMGDVRVTGVLNKDYALQIATDAGAEVGIGTEPLSDRKLHVFTESDTYGIYSSVTGGNPLIGGSKYGIYGSSNSSSCANYGVYGKATTDSQEINYGVYGYARNTNAASYAGYFDGAVLVTTSLYAGGNISAQSFTDRTPYPKDLETAYAAVMSMERLPEGQYEESNKEQQLDHSKMNSYILSDDGSRDLSATVSCQNEVLKDLLRRTEELEEARSTIRQLEQRLAVLESMIQSSQDLTVKGAVQ